VLRLRLHGAVLGGGARGRVCVVVDEAGPSGFRRYSNIGDLRRAALF
jgi:hypothetical protein